MRNEDNSVDVFKALADSTRRSIMHMLLTDQPLTINEISGRFDMSRQATTRHIYYLQEAGLLRLETQGRNTLCYPEYKPMKEVSEYLSYFDKFWNVSLNNLESYLDNKKK